MSENNQTMGGYGYVDDNVQSNSGSISFGLNQGVATMSKFEWIPNAGKDGAEAEALEIEFSVEGREQPIRYRKYPVTKAFDKQNGGAEVTDPNHPAFKDEQANFNQVVMHILGCFVEKDALKATFSKPISSFKEFCKVAESVLPKDYNTKSLDMFFQYQWQIADGKDRSYLELPKNMKQGKFLCPATTNNWKEVRTNRVLKYVDSSDEKVIHPFQRGEWFLQSNWANQQKEDSSASHEASASGGSAW